MAFSLILPPFQFSHLEGGQGHSGWHAMVRSAPSARFFIIQPPRTGTPGWLFHFRPQSGIFVRTLSPFGPILSPSAITPPFFVDPPSVGHSRGRWEVGEVPGVPILCIRRPRQGHSGGLVMQEVPRVPIFVRLCRLGGHIWAGKVQFRPQSGIL